MNMRPYCYSKELLFDGMARLTLGKEEVIKMNTGKWLVILVFSAILGSLECQGTTKKYVFWMITTRY